MKKHLSALLALLLFVSPVAAGEWKTPPPKAAVEQVEETLAVLWEGETDLDMLKQVRIDISRALYDKKKVLAVTLLSPGGPVITSLEITRQVKLAREKGLIVEIRGVALIASGATFVLSAGTPGRRFISRYTFFLVHPPQSSSWGGAPECLTNVPDPKSVQEKAINAILRIMRDMYMEFTKKSQEEVEKWLTCGNEIVGSGELALSLGMADEVRE